MCHSEDFERGINDKVSVSDGKSGGQGFIHFSINEELHKHIQYVLCSRAMFCGGGI